MRTVSGYILTNVLGWKIKGEFPDVKKSITIFAPHTAHIDALYGKLGIAQMGVKYLFLSKKELFFFPMNIVMKPTCIKYTNTYVYNIQACGFHQTIKLKIIY